MPYWLTWEHIGLWGCEWEATHNGNHFIASTQADSWQGHSICVAVQFGLSTVSWQRNFYTRCSACYLCVRLDYLDLLKLKSAAAPHFWGWLVKELYMSQWPLLCQLQIHAFSFEGYFSSALPHPICTLSNRHGHSLDQVILAWTTFQRY